MKRKTQKFYTVWAGRSTGVFDTWQECYKKTHKFEGALFKAFLTKQEADTAYNSDSAQYIGLGINQRAVVGEQMEWVGDPIIESIALQTYYNPIRDSIEYVGISVEFNNVLFKYTRLDNATNNIVSFLGLVHALAYSVQNGIDMPIYSDNTCAIKWVRKKAINTSLERSVNTEHIFNLTDRALHWLNSNEYSNKVLKWENAWGEVMSQV